MSELDRAIERTKGDPDMQRSNTAEEIGGCWDFSHRFAWYCHELGVSYRFLRWSNLPRMQTPWQHNVLADGLVVDWIAQQTDASAPWPLVTTLEEFEARGFVPHHEQICGTCGAPAELLFCVGITFDPLDVVDVLADVLDHVSELKAKASNG